LWGIGLRALAASLGDDAAPDGRAVASGVRGALDAITTTGKAQLGDKTMVDALIPFAEQLRDTLDAGASLADAWRMAAEAATTAAEDTAQLQPRIGRARSHPGRSLGTPDPGAVSLALAVSAVATTLTTTEGRS
jgi:dihydroxyacetone kinase